MRRRYMRECGIADAYAAENTVMIHISRIRSKIEINPAKPGIHKGGVGNWL